MHQNLNKITIFTTIGFLEQSVDGRCSRSWTGRTRAGSGQGFCKMWQSKREEIKNRKFLEILQLNEAMLEMRYHLRTPFWIFFAPNSNWFVDWILLLLFIIGLLLPLFICFMRRTFYGWKRYVDFSGIWTRIVGVKGERVDHWITEEIKQNIFDDAY